MIISASRRTDIPAFYSKWFINRIREGFFIKTNPMNPNQKKAISLHPNDIDIVVFWTKNPTPIIDSLHELDERNIKYMFQFTLNDYPKDLEPNVPSLNRRIESFSRVSNKIGSQYIIWRYDPIIFSNRTPENFHIERFSKISNSLKEFTNRAVISFVDMYGKVNKKFKDLQQDGYIFDDPNEIIFKVQSLSNKLSEIANYNCQSIFSCSEHFDLSKFGIHHGSCIDASLISKLLNREVKYKKDKGQRAECLCTESIDVGMYNTCQFNCKYCYATTSNKVVQNNLSKHDPNSPILIGNLDPASPPQSFQLKLI